QAQMAMEDHKRDEAKAILKKAIDANPDVPALYSQLASITGSCLDLKTEADCKAARAEAVGVYDKLIAIKPSAFAYAMRAIVRPPEDRQAKLDDIDLGIKTDPKAAISYITRAAVYIDAKDYDKALPDLNTALGLNPKDVSAFGLRARAYFASGKTDLAFADLDAMAAINPKDGGTLNNVCWERATRNHELDKALAQCNAALAIKPDDAAALDSRGMVELRLGKYDEALADYNAALKLRPDQADSLYGRGIVEARKGMKDESKADLDAARKSFAKIDEVWAGYGVKP
ncbi:MAG: tetratricopeptide repeat protein, partial [Asticcacaulis sp.]